jgi:hypothetical protein
MRPSKRRAEESKKATPTPKPTNSPSPINRHTSPPEKELLEGLSVGKFKVLILGDKPKMETVGGYKNDSIGVYELPDGSWNVVHLRSGRYYAKLATMGDALRAYKVLAREAWRGLRLHDKDEVVARTPRWIVQWCKRMSKTMKFESELRWKEATGGK